MELVSPEYRDFDLTTTEVANLWRDRIGAIPGARQLTFRSEIGRSRDPIDVELRGEDFDRLKQHYNEEEIVEIVSVIALFGFLNRWNSTLATELEAMPAALAKSLKLAGDQDA